MNTFQMSFGKMTTTLDDVPTLVGIPVIGHFVSLSQRITDSRELLVSLLGVSPGESLDELGLIRVTQFDWNGSVPSFAMSRMTHQTDILSVSLELICCIWSAALSSMTRAG